LDFAVLAKSESMVQDNVVTFKIRFAKKHMTRTITALQSLAMFCLWGILGS